MALDEIPEIQNDTHVPTIVRRIQWAALLRDDLLGQENWKAALRDVLDDAAAEIMRLRERLEIGFAYDLDGNRVACDIEPYDGIYCRDATIKLLEDRIAELKPKPTRRWKFWITR